MNISSKRTFSSAVANTVHEQFINCLPNPGKNREKFGDTIFLYIYLILHIKTLITNRCIGIGNMNNKCKATVPIKLAYLMLVGGVPEIAKPVLPVIGISLSGPALAS